MQCLLWTCLWTIPALGTVPVHHTEGTNISSILVELLQPTKCLSVWTDILIKSLFHFIDTNNKCQWGYIINVGKTEADNPIFKYICFLNISQPTLLIHYINWHAYPIIQSPADIFKVTIIQEHGRVSLHPRANLGHANCSYFWLSVPINIIARTQ